MIDHISLPVADFDSSREFYTKALAPLRMKILLEGERWAVMGRDDRVSFWFGSYGKVPPSLHIAFAAETRAQVNEFHAAAIAAGAYNNGTPSVRWQFHPNYYGGYVYDPNGHNIQAVCHSAED